MEKTGEQPPQKKQEVDETKPGGKLEGLPVETSPYTQYKDLEDYKKQGYGTEGHQEVTARPGGGATDAPTLSGEVTEAIKGQDAPKTV